jgi:hypothetical protein
MMHRVGEVVEFLNKLHNREYTIDPRANEIIYEEKCKLNRCLDSNSEHPIESIECSRPTNHQVILRVFVFRLVLFTKPIKLQV